MNTQPVTLPEPSPYGYPATRHMDAHLLQRVVAQDEQYALPISGDDTTINAAHIVNPAYNVPFRYKVVATETYGRIR